jgi:hypothetical protein
MKGLEPSTFYMASALASESDRLVAELSIGLVLVLGSITEKRDCLIPLIHVPSLDTEREVAGYLGRVGARLEE